MSKYIVVENFRDLEDRNASWPSGQRYTIGDAYPRNDFEVSEERLTELAGKTNALGRPVIAETNESDSLEALTVAQLKELAESKGIELDVKAKKAEIIEALSE